MAYDGLLQRLVPKALPRSLWVFHTNVGGCNGCDIEVLDVLTPYFDVERLGIRLVGSPRHADVLVVSGPVTIPMRGPMLALYEAVPDPKIVMAIGGCAVGGGLWFDTYNVVGGLDKVVKVDIHVPGCPPRPEAIIHGVAQLLKLAEKKMCRTHDAQETPEELAAFGHVPGLNGHGGPG
jgi:Ni,Fe-hydrogenase III small subunit